VGGENGRQKREQQSVVEGSKLWTARRASLGSGGEGGNHPPKPPFSARLFVGIEAIGF